MNPKNKAILNEFNLEDLPTFMLKGSIIEACKKMMIKSGIIPPVLIVVGRKHNGAKYCYNFNLVEHADANSSSTISDVDIINSILSDVKQEFKTIEMVVFQTLAHMVIDDIRNRDVTKEKIEREGIESLGNKHQQGAVLFFETPTKKEKEVIFKLGEKVFVASEFNKDLLEVEGNGPELGIYKQNIDMEKIQVTKKTLWETINIKKESFDFIDSILKEAKESKKGLSDVMRQTILSVRDKEYGEGHSTGTNISDYEMKLFLAGKIFEEKIKNNV